MSIVNQIFMLLKGGAKNSNIKLKAETCNFNKKETLAQVFSCEFSEISRNNFCTEHLRTTAFEH